MASLTATDWPRPGVTLLGAVAANAEDIGPVFLDSETVESLGDAIASGLLQVRPEWEAVIDATPAETVQSEFLSYLADSNDLSPYAPLLHRRRFALWKAIRAICEPTMEVGGADRLSPALAYRAIGNLDTWLALARERMAALGVTDEEIVRRLALLTPAQTAELLQVSEVLLSTWRKADKGPAYAVLGSRSYRYPVAALIEWIISAIPGSESSRTR